MAFHGIEHVKSAYERLQGRLSNIRKEGEKIAARTFAIVETEGTAAGMGWANERFGEASKDDPNGFRELKVLGCPVDLGGGIVGMGLTILGAFGNYEEHFFNVSNGLGSAFAYRFGAEFGRRAAADAKKTKTSGAPALGTAPAGYQPGRAYHVEYAQQG